MNTITKPTGRKAGIYKITNSQEGDETKERDWLKANLFFY